MKDSDVYLRAAELVITGHDKVGGFSCFAIDEAFFDVWGFYGGYEQVKCYEKYFKPKGSRYSWGNSFARTPENCKNCRVLALLFMHEIAKDKERKAK